MDWIMVVSFTYSLVTMAVAILAGFGILRFLDWVSGIDFTSWAENAGDVAMAIYLGMRLLAVCALLGLLLS